MPKDPADELPSNLDLSAMSLSQLSMLQIEIEKQKASARERERHEVKTRVIGVLEAAGFSVMDLPSLFPPPARGPARSKPVFRHPSKPKLTWSGIGRKPRWVNDHLAVQGTSLDQLKVK